MMKIKRKEVLITIVAIATLAAIMVLSLTGCGNKQVFDTTYNFNYGYVTLPNGEVIEGKVTSWMDYSESDMVQVVINGKTYLTFSSNVVLVSGQ
jgi:uncharacterized lipoprotein NlpE involved in copper resistance